MCFHTSTSIGYDVLIPQKGVSPPFFIIKSNAAVTALLLKFFNSMLSYQRIIMLV